MRRHHSLFRLRFVLAAILALGAVITAAGTPANIAHAAPGDPPGTTLSVTHVLGVQFLIDVACETGTTCIALASDGDVAGVVPFINGMPGTPTMFPTGIFPKAIACPSSTTCYAVGSDSNKGEGFVETITSGQPGSITDVANTSSLNGITCLSATLCYAVGASGTQGAFLPVSGGHPGTAAVSDVTGPLDAIACISAAACYAGGNDGFGDGEILIISNGVPDYQNTLFPSGSSTVAAIACPGGSTICYAVGPNFNNVGEIAEVVDGTIGTVTTATGTSTLNGIGCSSVFCVAGGVDSSGQIGVEVPITLPFGTVGNAIPVRNTTGLNGVTCPTVTTCLAAGGAQLGGGALVSVTNAPVPNLSPVTGTSLLRALTCVNQAACFGVGTNATGALGSVVEFLNGTALAAMPAGGISTLNAIACPTSITCYAVGSAGDAGAGLADIVDGRISDTSSIPGVATLTGIACSSASLCYAVGQLAPPGSGGVLLPLNNGVPGTPVPVGSNITLTGITCPHEGSCIVTGTSGNGVGVIATVTNGAPGPVLPVPGTTALYGVTCLSDSCEVIGSSATAGVVVPVTLRTGASPFIGLVTTVAGTTSLNAIACSYRTTCTAVGQGDPTYGPGVVVSLRSTSVASVTPVPGTSAFFGIACPTTSACESVGQDYNQSIGVLYGPTWTGQDVARPLFTVTSTADAPDPTPNDAICDTAPTGPARGACTLRAAVQTGDNEPAGAAVTINLPSNTQPYRLTAGPLILSTNTFTITGAVRSGVIIDGAPASSVIENETNSTLSGMTISGGTGTLTGPGVTDGGGIYDTAGTLNLSNISFTGNQASFGGGLAQTSTAPLTLSDVAFRNNSSVVNSSCGNCVGAAGGGYFGTGPTSWTYVLVLNNSVTCNGCAGQGGGVDARGTFTGSHLTITTNQLNSNAEGFSPYGGGIVGGQLGTMNITTSTVENNTSSQGGGGFAAEGAVLLSASTIENNTAGFGAGVYVAGAVSGLPSGSLLLTNDTVTGNSAPEGAGISSRGQVIATGSTIENNSAQAAFLPDGGGIFTRGFFMLNQSTVSGNAAGTVTPCNGEGGGIEVEGVGPLVTNGATITGNSAGQGAGLDDIRNGQNPSIINNTAVTNNSACNGGGLAEDFHAPFALNGDTFTGNNATQDGGAIYLPLIGFPFLNVGITNTQITGNSAGGQTGGIWNAVAGVFQLFGSSSVTGNSAPGTCPNTLLPCT